MYTIGIDVGATKIAVGLVGPGGKILKQEKLLTEVNKGPKAVLRNIINAASIFYAPKVKAIGLGIAGQMNPWQGQAFFGPNFPKALQKNINLAKMLKKEFKVPVFLDNDANCFALAEAVYGAGKKYKYVVGVTFGTGLGSGTVINKKLYRGRDNSIELGHIIIDKAKDALVCGCGKTGHLESYASGRGIAKIYRKLTGKKKPTTQITAMAWQGNKRAKQAVDQACSALSIGLANFIVSFNPDIIVVGGGLMKVGIAWQKIVRRTKGLIPFPIYKGTKIVKSQLGDKAGILGAALITSKQ
jgi:glucokinase